MLWRCQRTRLRIHALENISLWRCLISVCTSHQRVRQGDSVASRVWTKSTCFVMEVRSCRWRLDFFPRVAQPTVAMDRLHRRRQRMGRRRLRQDPFPHGVQPTLAVDQFMDARHQWRLPACGFPISSVSLFAFRVQGRRTLATRRMSTRARVCHRNWSYMEAVWRQGSSTAASGRWLVAAPSRVPVEPLSIWSLVPRRTERLSSRPYLPNWDKWLHWHTPGVSVTSAVKGSTASQSLGTGGHGLGISCFSLWCQTKHCRRAACPAWRRGSQWRASSVAWTSLNHCEQLVVFVLKGQA